MTRHAWIVTLAIAVPCFSHDRDDIGLQIHIDESKCIVYGSPFSVKRMVISSICAVKTTGAGPMGVIIMADGIMVNDQFILCVCGAAPD